MPPRGRDYGCQLFGEMWYNAAMKRISILLALLAAFPGFAAALVPELPAEGAQEQLEFYADAARRGSPRAMLALAHYNEHGIGMATNRAEALRWYRGVLSASGGSSRAIVEAAEKGLARLGGDMLPVDATSTSGNGYLDLIAAQTNRESAFFVCNALRNKLLGKTLVFTNMAAWYVQRRKDGGIKLALEIPRDCRPRAPRDHDTFHPYDYPILNVHVYFDGADAQVARHFDRGDRVVRIEGLVTTNWTWQGGISLKGVSVEPQDKSFADPLPPFDAAAITGDELLAYFKQQRRIRKWQYVEIQSRLAGRRLVFHDLRLSGSHRSAEGTLDPSFWIEAVPRWERIDEGDITGCATFKLAFSTDATRRFALGLARAGSFALLDEVTGTFSRVEDPDDGWALQLEDVSLVPKGAKLDIADDGKSPLPGDEVVRQVGLNFTPVAKLGLCSRFAEREIAFTSGVIESCRADWSSNTVAVVCRMAPQSADGGRLNPLRVSFTIPAEKTGSLRRTPIPGDLVVGLKGRLPASPFLDDRAYYRSRSDSPMLELVQPDFSITWKSDVAKTNGLETKTGERIVRRLGLCWSEVRQDQLLRLARVVDGRTVDFPAGRVHTASTQDDGTVFVEVGLEDPLLGECANLTIVVPPGKLAEQAAIMKYGVRIRRIHGVIRAELGKSRVWEAESMRVRLKDASFEIVPPAAKPRR